MISALFMRFGVAFALIGMGLGIFMGATHDLSAYSRDGCLVDYARLPLEIAWGRSALNPAAVAQSKAVAVPVHGGPNQ